MERVQQEQASRDAANAGHVSQGKSAQLPAQTDIASRIHSSPLIIVQRKQLQGMFGGAAQLQEVKDEPLQGIFANLSAAWSSDGLTRGSSVVQRKIGHDGKVFTTDGKRPGWRQHLKASTASELGVASSANFATLGYDRAHRIPFAALEELICDFCNGNATSSELKDLTDSLYNTTTTEYTSMVNARKDLIQSFGGSVGNVRLFANSLLSYLNSATLNVSPGNFSENRGIQDHPDYGYQQSPGGTSYDLTPRSQQLHDVWGLYGREPALSLTPGGEHVRSSQISSAQQQSGSLVNVTGVNW